MQKLCVYVLMCIIVCITITALHAGYKGAATLELNMYGSLTHNHYYCTNLAKFDDEK